MLVNFVKVGLIVIGLNSILRTVICRPAICVDDFLWGMEFWLILRWWAFGVGQLHRLRGMSMENFDICRFFLQM